MQLFTEFAVEQTQCQKCGAVLFGGEQRYSPCCNNGKCVLTDEQFHPWSAAYVDRLRRHPILLTQSAFVNGNLAFGGICVRGNPGGFGYHAGYGIVGSSVKLQGRVYRNLNFSDDFYMTYMTSAVPPNPSEDINAKQNAIDDLRNWLCEHHPAGIVMFDEYEAVAHSDEYIKFREYADASCSAENVRVVFAPDSIPPVPEEFGSIGRAHGLHYQIPKTILDVSSATEIEKESLCYPLIYPSGVTPMRDLKAGYVGAHTIRKHTKYVLYQKYFPFLGRLSRLTEQFVLDAYSRSEEHRFQQIAQQASAVNMYTARRATAREIIGRTQPLAETGRKWALPASIPGTPGYCRRLIENGMTVIAKKGKPSLFITATMNSSHCAVNEALNLIAPHESQAPRISYSFVTSRVFHDLLKQLHGVLRRGDLFGNCKYLQSVTEWQKRGLDHAHILLGLEQIPSTAYDVNSIVSARLFHGELCPYRKFREDECTCFAHNVYQLVRKHMIHKCLVGRCKKTPDDVCKKGFPKAVCPTTFRDEQGRWHYQRAPQDVYVVPYNSALLIAMQSHVNVEICTGDGAAAYIRKYLSKMSDCVDVAILREPNSNEDAHDQLLNECLEWQRLRYVSSPEAVCRVLGHEINVCEPATIFVYVHLEGEKTVTFRPDDFVATVEAKISELSLFDRYLFLSAPILFKRHTALDM